MVIFEGNLTADKSRYAIVVSRWNSFITSKMLDGSIDALTRHGVEDDDIEVAWVPGTWEAPLVVQTLADTGKYDAIICLGAILRGDTPHAEYLAAEVSKGLASVSLKTEVPITWGVITCDNLEQAIERAGSKQGNKGAEAAVSAIETVNLLRTIRKESKT